MPKRPPEERWQLHVLEQYQAFRLSEEFKVLRGTGLRALGRRTLLTGDEWNRSFTSRVRNDGFMAFADDCRVAGKRFGLAQWTVSMACLLRGYKPEFGQIQVEERPGKVHVVTEIVDDSFIRWLLYEAHQLGIRVLARQGSTDFPLIAIPMPTKPEQPLTRDQRPELHQALYVRVETPPLYPPEAAADLHRQAQQEARELLRRLGYRVPKRQRSSALPAEASKLRIKKGKLARREAGDIALDVFGEKADGSRAVRNRVKDKRHKLKKRWNGVREE